MAVVVIPTQTRSETVAHRGTLAVVAALATNADETATASPIAGTSATAQAIVTMAVRRLKVNVGTVTMHSLDNYKNPA
jgi:hypothetical protein